MQGMEQNNFFSEFPKHGLQPKIETGVTEFLSKNPAADGTGIVIAIIDTGVDPLAEGLQKCSNGSVKVVDVVDCSGDGDVFLTEECIPDSNNVLTGLSGKKLQLNSTWKNASGKFKLGIVRLYDLYSKELVERVTARRKESFMKENSLLLAKEQHSFDCWSKVNTSIDSSLLVREKEDFEARLSSLLAVSKSYEDIGPVIDVVSFFDGTHYRAVFDLEGDGDLTNAMLFTDYKHENQCGTFSKDDMLTFNVNFYENGSILSIVTTNNSHGTHVAAITAAYFEDHPEKNGIAPGAQIVSLKIGDSRLGTRETGISVARAIRMIKEWNCDLVNMSYGEMTANFDEGFFIEQMQELVTNHGVIFVSSAGNEGPGISTVGAPGGTSSCSIGVGAYVTKSMMSAEYSLLEKTNEMPFSWSSRGPTLDGYSGVTCYAPGAAITSVPRWSLSSNMRMNGTSMSSPNACGCIALVLSALKQQKVSYSFERIKNALLNSTKPIEDVQNIGLINVPSLYENILRNANCSFFDFKFEVIIPELNKARGIYIRKDITKIKREYFTVQVNVKFPREMNNNLKINFETHLNLVPSASWISVPEHLHLSGAEKAFNVCLNYEELKDGFNCGFISAIDSSQSYNSIFRIPVTVIKPIAATEKLSKNLILNNGMLERLFLSCPKNASIAKLSLTNANPRTNSKSTYVCLQSVLLKKLKNISSTWKCISLSPSQPYTINLDVIEGEIVEICLGPYWLTSGPLELDMDITFDGIGCKSSELVLMPNSLFSIFNFVPFYSGVQYSFTTKFDGLVRTLSPKSQGLISVLDERSCFTYAGIQLFQCLLSYSFKLDKFESEILPLINLVTDSLYDMPIVSFLIQIYQSSTGKRVYFGDSFGKISKKFKQGSYDVSIQFVHSDKSQLEKLKNAPFSILIKDIPKGNSGKIEIYPSLSSYVRNECRIEKLASSVQSQIVDCILSVDIGEYSGGQQGDILQYSLNFNKTFSNETAAQSLRIKKILSAPIKDEPIVLKKEQSSDTYLSGSIDLIKKLPSDSNERKMLINSLDSTYAKECKWLVAKFSIISQLSNDDIISISNQIENLVNFDEIIAFEGKKKIDAEVIVTQEKERISQLKNILIEALYRKLLVYQSYPTERFNLEEYESSFAKLSQLIDAHSIIIIYVWRKCYFKRFGTALRALLKAVDEESFADFSFSPALPELVNLKISLLRSLHWDIWADLESRWKIFNFPKERSRF